MQHTPHEDDGFVTHEPTGNDPLGLAGYAPGLQSKMDILAEAATVLAERGERYDGAEDNFPRIARLFNAYLVNKLGVDVRLEPQDVAVLMILLKVGRLGNDSKHLDSYIDIAGYAACGGDHATRDR